MAALKMAFLAVAPASFSSGLVGGEFQNATVVPTTEQKEFSDLQNNNNSTTMVYWNDTAQKKGVIIYYMFHIKCIRCIRGMEVYE